MSSTHTRSAAPLGAAPAKPQAGGGWRHPFDSAAGTITLGVLLTIALFLALRLLGG
jgi:hypothetical protein